MNLKQCGKCKEIKEEKEFTIKNKRKNLFQNECKTCTNLYKKEWYRNNSKIHKERVKIVNERKKQELRSIILKAKDAPCVDCRQKYIPFAMDFDHLPGTKKSFNIGIASGRNHCSVKTLLEEIAKCDLVCSNCHRIRTYNRVRQDGFEPS